ncbi:N-acetyltransferase [Opitutaceae bacterium EW11]|nr:N-acetyltransferase [Opitutaceae bacterium EW11]
MTTPPFSLRSASESDLPAIVRIYNQTIASRMVTADTEPVSVESRVAWFRAHNPKTRPLWVSEAEGQTVGWLSFNSFYGRPAYNGTVEVSIYVDEQHRRRGVGRWLLQEAVRRSPECGVTTLLGFIFAHNEPSLKLFAQFGFERWAHLPRIAVLDEIERDLIIVGRRVDAA